MAERIWLLLACAALASACDGSRSDCVAGATQACLGPGRCEGVQSCNAEGTAFEACLCEARPGTDGGPVITLDAGPGTDAGSPGTDAGNGADAGRPIDAGRSTDAGAGSGGPYRVFVTSATYTGDIQREPASPGLESADTYCQLAATAASLGGTWRAFLSTESVDAIDRVAGEGPWVNMLGSTVFPNRAALEVSGPMASMRYDENGDSASTGLVWTGSSGSKRYLDGYACQGWTSSDLLTYGQIGDLYSSTSTGWVSYDIANCGNAYALLCFEQ